MSLDPSSPTWGMHPSDKIQQCNTWTKWTCMKYDGLNDRQLSPKNTVKGVETGNRTPEACKKKKVLSFTFGVLVCD